MTKRTLKKGPSGAEAGGSGKTNSRIRMLMKTSHIAHAERRTVRTTELLQTDRTAAEQNCCKISAKIRLSLPISCVFFKFVFTRKATSEHRLFAGNLDFPSTIFRKFAHIFICFLSRNNLSKTVSVKGENSIALP